MDAKANEAPEKLYVDPEDRLSDSILYGFTEKRKEDDIEYTRTDAFVNKVVNFLNYKLDDVVAIRVGGTIIPHHVAKQELIEDFKKYMKEEYKEVKL